MNLVRGGRTAASCGGLRSVNILMQENICDELLKHRTVDQLREHGLFEIMPQIHFWFLHYSLLNILTRLPENYIEHQEFFVNSDFFAKICNIFYKSNSFY